MPLNLKQAVASLNAGADAKCALLNDGYLRLYDGEQPATADTPITSQTLLAELRFAAKAYSPAVGGVAKAKEISSGVAKATGQATWYRCLKSDGTTPCRDGSVGTDASNLILPTVSIQKNAAVSVTTLVYTEAT